MTRSRPTRLEPASVRSLRLRAVAFESLAYARTNRCQLGCHLLQWSHPTHGTHGTMTIDSSAGQELLRDDVGHESLARADSSRRTPAWSRLLAFAGLIVAGGAGARLLEMLRDQGRPWHGMVTFWTSFAAVFGVTTVAAVAGAMAGKWLGGRATTVLLAGTFAGIAAILGNPVAGVFWGVWIGFIVASPRTRRPAVGLPERARINRGGGTGTGAFSLGWCVRA